MQDRIEKSIELRAPIEKVWHALTDYRQFGAWFRVKLDGPFVVGADAIGHITYPGYEHLQWKVHVKAIEPLRLFSFTWHPYAVDPDTDYSLEPPTLVEFTLQEIANGTRVIVTESGFDKIPASRREEAFRMNEGGWEEQMKNIRVYVEA